MGTRKSSFVNGRFAAGKRHSVIAGEDDQRLVIEIGLFQDLDQSCYSLIDTRT